MLVRKHSSMDLATLAPNPTENPAAADGEDRLSQLPDRILYHILSFPSINIRDIVRMSVLSRRWEHLWASMPYLSFNDALFPWRDEYEDDEDIGDKIGPFERFVNNVLILRAKSDFEYFILNWNCKYDSHRQNHLNIWLKHAVQRNVNLIALTVDTDNQPLEWPGCIFTCQSLEELYLTYSRPMNVSSPKFVALSQLNTVRLTKFITDDNYVEKLISGCPILDELCLLECQINNSLEISSHSLKHLAIAGCDIHGTIFRLSAPSLRTFWFIGNSAYVPHIVLENTSSLVKARILTDNNHSRYKYAGSAFNLLRGLSSVETLEIDSSSIERMTKEEVSELPAFHNLKGVTLSGWNRCGNSILLSHFLRCSPNLKRLRVANEKLTQQITGNEEASWKPKEVRFSCPHLKVVTILLLNGGEFDGSNESVVRSVCNTFASKCKCVPKVSTAP